MDTLSKDGLIIHGDSSIPINNSETNLLELLDEVARNEKEAHEVIESLEAQLAKGGLASMRPYYSVLTDLDSLEDKAKSAISLRNSTLRSMFSKSISIHQVSRSVSKTANRKFVLNLRIKEEFPILAQKLYLMHPEQDKAVDTLIGTTETENTNSKVARISVSRKSSSGKQKMVSDEARELLNRFRDLNSDLINNVLAKEEGLKSKNPANKYIRKKILDELNIASILEKVFDFSNPEEEKEAVSIMRKIEADGIDSLDKKTIDKIFANPLRIKSKIERDALNNYVEEPDDLKRIAAEEEYAYKQALETKKAEKFAMWFKREHTGEAKIEDSVEDIIRRTVRENIDRQYKDTGDIDHEEIVENSLEDISRGIAKYDEQEKASELAKEVIVRCEHEPVHKTDFDEIEQVTDEERKKSVEDFKKDLKDNQEKEDEAEPQIPSSYDSDNS